MYKIMRWVLIVTVFLLVYLAVVLVYALPYAGLGLLLVLLWRECKKTHRSTAHGTARWASASDIPHMLEGNGLMVGHLCGRATKLAGAKALFNALLPSRLACRQFLIAFQRKQAKQCVRLTQAVHTAVFAPTGVGKGVSFVIPFVLTCRDSMVIYDVKGEIANLTASVRRKMGHRVIVLDPYRMTTQQPDSFNPLEFIDKDSETALDDIRDLAEALVVRTGQEREATHWLDSAEVWIAAMIAVVVCFAEGIDKSLQSVRLLLTNQEKMQAAIKMMCESDAMDGMLSRLGNQLGQFKDKELSSTLTTTNRFLRFLDTMAIADSTRENSFDPADLLKKKMTVYLVLPPDRMRAQTALVRMWISSMLRAVVKGGLQNNAKVHFVLDEAASLGHLDCLDDAVDKFRGYGVRLLLIWQSLAQLRKVFPDGQDQNLLGNVTQVFFGVNDPQTAEYVSSRLGEGTIVTNSGGIGSSTSWQSSEQGKGSRSYSTSSNDNWQFMGRKLLMAEEVATLDERTAITFAPGTRPIATRLIRYYEKDFDNTRGMGPIRAAFDAACLFVPTTVAAVMLTVGLVNHGFANDRRIPRSHPQNPIPLKDWSAPRQ